VAAVTPAAGEGRLPTQPEPAPAQPDTPAPWWSFPLTTWAAVGAVLAWFAVQLARYVGEAPDLDSLIGFRGSVLLYHEGFGGLVSSINGEGIHPPVMDVVNFASFALFGTAPASIQLASIVLFALFAGGVERLLAPYLDGGRRVLAALAITICPALALTLYSVWREGFIMLILLVALILALKRGGVGPRPLALGAVLALLPVTKETGIVFVIPFAVDAALTGAPALRERIRRVAYVLGMPIAAAVVWRLAMAIADAPPWQTWIFSEHADDGPYVVAARAMFGFEEGIYLRQNLANAFIVNYLWLPAILALVTLVLIARRPAAAALRRPAAILVGLVAVYTWTTLTYPTFTEPRYAAPVIMLTLLLVFIGLRQWPRRAQPVIIGALLFVFVAGAWSPTDPISRAIWGTTSVGGEQIYDTAERQRGPDRMNINFAPLNASRRINARLRRIYASDATLVAGDCNAMKFGEKLAAVGSLPSAFDRAIPGARPLKCVFPKDLPPGAANGPERIALVRTPEEDASGQPLAFTGPSIIVIH
jgi:hypothetical protein